jgi:putative FmdB family regulatory protein
MMATSQGRYFMIMVIRSPSKRIKGLETSPWMFNNIYESVIQTLFWVLTKKRTVFSKEEHMPLYEFRCPQCGAEFERIVFRADEGPVQCPTCGALNPERLLSVFSSGKAAGDAGTSAASSCRPPSRGFS